MIVNKTYSHFMVLCLLCCLRLPALAQHHWLQGEWKYFAIAPDTAAGYVLHSSLSVTEVQNNELAAIQRVYAMPDTSVFIDLQWRGILANGNLTFTNSAELSRHEPDGAYLWQSYSYYTVRKSYFSIREQRLLLHIEADGEGQRMVRSFTYYRELNEYDEATRLMLLKRYGTPQILDDMPLLDSVRAVADSLPEAIATRTNSLVKTLQVASPDIQVIVLDDAEIDGDIISLYHNNQMVLSHKMLGREMVKYTMKADRQHAHHEFILVAENLGSIPPNTALMRIRAGGIKYEFIVHSDMNQNAKFIIDYAGE